MIAQGRYRARAVNGDFGNSKNKGTPFVLVNFEIVEGDHQGEVLSWSGFFTDKTEQRTVESLRTCGCEFADNNVTNLSGIDRNEVQIVVEHEDYQDDTGASKTIAKVAWVNSFGRGISVEQQMDPGARAAFAERMKGRVLQSKQRTPATSSQASKPAAHKNGSAPARGSVPEPDYPTGDEDPLPF